MRETALHAHLAARGATHAADREVVLPRRFGDAGAEYAALRHAAALVDLGFRTIVRATGPDGLARERAGWTRSRDVGSRSACRASGSTWTAPRSSSRCPSSTRSVRPRGATSDRR